MEKKIPNPPGAWSHNQALHHFFEEPSLESQKRVVFKRKGLEFSYQVWPSVAPHQPHLCSEEGSACIHDGLHKAIQIKRVRKDTLLDGLNL